MSKIDTHENDAHSPASASGPFQNVLDEIQYEDFIESIWRAGRLYQKGVKDEKTRKVALLNRFQASEKLRELIAARAEQAPTQQSEPTDEQIEAAIKRAAFCKDNSEMFRARTIIELQMMAGEDWGLLNNDRDTVRDALRLIGQLMIAAGVPLSIEQVSE